MDRGFDGLVATVSLNCSCELMNFRSCKLANLPHQKSPGYADNGGMSLLLWQSVMKVPKLLNCLNCPKFGQLIIRKIIGIVVTRCQLLYSAKCYAMLCSKLDFGWSSFPDPAGGSLIGTTADCQDSTGTVN